MLMPNFARNVGYVSYDKDDCPYVGTSISNFMSLLFLMTSVKGFFTVWDNLAPEHVCSVNNINNFNNKYSLFIMFQFDV